jgi:hypothetical protein
MKLFGAATSNVLVGREDHGGADIGI